MVRIEETERFSNWLAALRDPVAKAKIAIRIQRLAFGNPGDIAPIGGDKSTQRKDIVRAQALAKDFRSLPLT